MIHGRPFPLEGKEYANVFVHFEPVDEEGNRAGEKINNEEKGRLNLHRAAAEGDLERVKKIVNEEVRRTMEGIIRDLVFKYSDTLIVSRAGT